jgi:hypothetical protein
VNPERLASIVVEQDDAEDVKDLDGEKAKFGLPALDAAAEQRLRYLESRSSEIAGILKRTAFDEDVRATLVRKYPGRDVYYQAVETWQDTLRDRVFGQQSRLVRARAKYAELTPADCTPQRQENEQWRYFPKWGHVAPRIFSVYESLASLPPTKDIDEAVKHLLTAHAALQERLTIVAASRAENTDAPAV